VIPEWGKFSWYICWRKVYRRIRQRCKPEHSATFANKADRSGRFVPLASGFAGDEDALPIRAEARVLGATLKAGDSAEYRLSPDRYAYLVAAVGR
jgi:hypothetical protein